MNWAQEAKKQKAIKKLTTEAALARVAYWRRELLQADLPAAGLKLTRKILKLAPERKFMMPSDKEWLLRNNPLTRYLFGYTSNPPVMADVRSEVFDFIDQAARRLMHVRPKANAPRFERKELAKEVLELTGAAIRAYLFPPKKSSWGPIAPLILLWWLSEK